MNELLSTLFLLDGFQLSKYVRKTLYAGWMDIPNKNTFWCGEVRHSKNMQEIKIDGYWNYLIKISQKCFDEIFVVCNFLYKGHFVTKKVEFSFPFAEVIEHSANIATLGNYLIGEMMPRLQEEYAYQLLMAAKTE